MTRFDRLRSMELGEMADFLLKLTDYDERLGYCQGSAECDRLLDEDKEITAQMCHNCMVGWLLGEGELI